jgi:hypothetical protein
VIVASVSLGVSGAADAAPSCTANAFTFTAKLQECVVPNGTTHITHIHVVAVGAAGAGALGGAGAKVSADLPVGGGTILFVAVGGFNFGGGGGPEGSFRQGGGASDVRTAANTLESRLLVAGGGGGAGEETCPPEEPETCREVHGGAALENGASGESLPGAEGGAGAIGSTPGAGGKGNCEAGQKGALGSGGGGADGAGGGGGGYYGGGGGGGTANNTKPCEFGVFITDWLGGGGGGSSFVQSPSRFPEFSSGAGLPASVTITAPAPSTEAGSHPLIQGTPAPGQELSVVRASWKPAPDSFTNEWLRCNAEEKNCTPIPGASALNYSVTAEDLGSRIAFRETASNYYGSATASTLGGGQSPLIGSGGGTGVSGGAGAGGGGTTAPAGSAPPVLSGSAIVGRTIASSPGLWANAPTSFAYQWQSCDLSNSSCVNIAGAVGASYTVAVANLGRRLRAVVTATNAAGSAVAISGLSSVVGAAIKSAMSWSFGWTRLFTTVKSLVVQRPPTGAIIEVTCRGKGCPFAHAHASATHPSCRHKKRCRSKRRPATAGELELAGLFKGRRLGLGTQITVSIVKSGWIGEAFIFTTRAGKKPSEYIACLGPGSSQPGVGC